MLHEAKLPAKRGFVEVEDSYGSRKYQKIPSIDDQVILQSAQLQAATDRQEFLEDCIAELAIQVYS